MGQIYRVQQNVFLLNHSALGEGRSLTACWRACRNALSSGSAPHFRLRQSNFKNGLKELC